MIHQYQLGGYNIVLDICSGGVHVVDEIAYDIISLFESYSKEHILSEIGNKYPNVSEQELEACYGQVLELKYAGM